MGGCCSRAEKETAIEVLFQRSLCTDEAKLMEQQALEIEALTRSHTEDILIPAQQRVADAREAYREQLAQTTNQRFAGGRNSVGSRAPVKRSERAVADAEKAFERAQEQLHERIAEMQARHRRELGEDAIVYSHEGPAAAAWSSGAGSSPARRPSAPTPPPVEDEAEWDDEDEIWVAEEERRVREEQMERRRLQAEKYAQARQLKQARALRAQERIRERAERNREEQLKRQERLEHARQAQPAAWQQIEKQRRERRLSSGGGTSSRSNSTSSSNRSIRNGTAGGPASSHGSPALSRSLRDERRPVVPNKAVVPRGGSLSSSYRPARAASRDLSPPPSPPLGDAGAPAESLGAAAARRAQEMLERIHRRQEGHDREVSARDWLRF